MKPELEPRTRDVAGEVRTAARRQAQGLQGALVGIVAVGITAFVMVAFIALDYVFHQDPHRIAKVAIGLMAIGGILAVPHFGLLLVPVVTPFLAWVPPTPIPGLNLLNVLLFSIFGTYSLGRILSRQPVFRANLLGPAIGWLVLICTLGIVRGAVWPTGLGFNAPAAVLQLFRAVTTFSTYFIVLAMARGIGARRRIAWAILTGLVVESLVTVALGRNGSGQRAVGSVGQANELGAYLALFSVLAISLSSGVKHALGKLTLVGVWLLGSFAIMLSLSRASMLALLAGTVFVTWRGNRVLLAAFLALLVLSPVWMPDYLKERISQSATQEEDGVSVDMAAERRLETWQTIFKVVEDHPFDGVGYTGLGYILPDLGAELGLTDLKDSAHNTYLRMLSEMGVFGLGLFVWLIWKCIWLGWVAASRARTRFDRALADGLVGGMLSMAVTCAFGDRFFNVVIASSLWILCALVEDSIWPEPAKEAHA
ncbi:MAG: O-antigen ligase family protein [Candidatus Eisenbacteria bacterium]